MRNLLFIIIILISLALFFFFIIIRRIKRGTRLLTVTGALILTLSFIILWFIPHWEYPAVSGNYQISSQIFTYTDAHRIETYEGGKSQRWLNVEIWYPANHQGEDNSCPLIVFSHGSLGKKESNNSLFRELASHGYAVCSIDHTYQSLKTLSADGKKIGADKEYVRALLQSNDKKATNREKLFENFKQWMEIRVGDINFVIDTIIEKSNIENNDIYRLIDTSKIGIIGHSMGGAAALGIGRTRQDIDAVINLEAPFMCDVIGIEDGNFIWNEEPYPVPLFNVYTDSSWKILSKSPQYAQNYKFLNDDNPSTADLYIKGAGHMNLTDLSLSNPPLCLAFGQDMFFDAENNLIALNKECLDFFDNQLKISK